MSNLGHFQQEYDLLSEKIHHLRMALAIETDAAVKFKLEKQIEEAEAERNRIEQQLSGAEKLAVKCPYRGLSAFREQDESFFFGREACTEKVVEALQKKPFVAVIGASGSGKSSLVYAGLIPRLRRQSPLEGGRGVSSQGWVIVSFRPGDHPLRALSSVLIPFLEPDLREVDQLVEINKLTENLRSGQIQLNNILERIRTKCPDSRILIFVDQFEEIYALCDDAEERICFINNLLQAIPLLGGARGGSIIITLRSDFLGQTHSHPELSHLIAEYNIIISALNTEELRRAITEPAKKAGHPLNNEIVELLIEQSEGHEGALPLLEFALTRVWEGMANGVELTDTLKQIGGVGGALANKAQDLFDSISETEQQIARRAFLAMIRLGEGTRDTRRRVNIADIVAHKDDPQQVHNVLRHFAHPGARLITLADDSAEITHEALFEHWEALKSWLDDSRDDLRFHRQLEETVKEWEVHNRPEGSLWRLPKLDLLRQYHQRNEQNMTALQVAFFQESEQKEKQTRFWKRATRAGLVLLTVISVIGAMWAVRSERIARQESEKAKISEIEALNQTSKAIFLSKNDELGALLMSLKAGKMSRHLYVPTSLKYQIITTLREIVCNIHEKNRLIGHLTHTEITSIAFSPDDKLFASGVVNPYEIKIWNVQDGSEVATLYNDYYLTSIVFSPNGKFLASGSHFSLWNIEENKEFNLLNEHSGIVTSIAFSKDSKLIALGYGKIILRNVGMISSTSNESHIELWDIIENKKLITLRGHADGVTSVAFSPDGKLLVSGSLDHTIKLWDVGDGKEFTTLHGHSDSVMSIAFSPNGQLIASGSSDETIKLWNVENRNEYLTLKTYFGAVNSVAFSSDGSLLASGGQDSIPRLWSIDENRKFHGLLRTIGFVSDIHFSLDGRALASESISNAINIRNIPNGQEIARLFGHLGGISSTKFSQDGKLFASGGFDGTIKLWNVENWQEIATLDGGSEWIESLAFCPDKKLFASGNNEGTIKLWRVADGKEIFTLSKHSGPVRGLVFSPDNVLLASGSWDGTIRLWRVAEGREVFMLSKQSNINSVVFSPDGKLLAWGGADNSIKIWNIADGKEFATLKGHAGVVINLSFSPDGKLLASGDEDKTVKLWDVYKGKEIATLQGHSEAVWRVAFSPDGRILISESWNGSMMGNSKGEIILWNLNLDDLLAQGCKWIYGYLKTNSTISTTDRTLCDDILNKE